MMPTIYLIESKCVWNYHIHYKKYEKFINFLENISTQHNTTLVKSIKSGFDALFEGDIHDSIDPGRTIAKQADAILSNPTASLKAASGNTKMLMIVMYPILADLAKKISETNPDQGEIVFTRMLNTLHERMDEINADYLKQYLDSVSDPQEISKITRNFFTNFASKWVGIPTRRDIIRQQYNKEYNTIWDGDMSQKYVRYNKDARQEHGEKQKNGEYVVPRGKSYGKIISIDGSGVRVKWKDHTIEVVPMDELEVYDMVNMEDTMNTQQKDESDLTNVADTRQHDSESDSYLDDEGEIFDHLITIINSLTVKSNIKAALKLYIKTMIHKDADAHKAATIAYKNAKRNKKAGYTSGADATSNIRETRKQFKSTRSLSTVQIAKKSGLTIDQFKYALQLFRRAVTNDESLVQKNSATTDRIYA